MNKIIHFFVITLIFVFNTAMAQEQAIYFNEDFQGLSVSQNSTSAGTLPQGWTVYDPLHSTVAIDVTRTDGINQFITINNPVSKCGIETPELSIKENTKLKFKIATTDPYNMIVKIRIVKEVEKKVIAHYYGDILTANHSGNLDTSYEKEVEMSAYAGQNLKLQFEIFPQGNAVNSATTVFLDDIQLVRENTTSTGEVTYYTEDFQSFTIPYDENTTTKTADLPQGWHRGNGNINIERGRGDNQFLALLSFSPKKGFSVNMPDLLIRENTTLKFRVALVSRITSRNIGTLKIKKINGSEEEVIQEFNLSDIQKGYFSGGSGIRYEKKIDLSAYAGQQLKLRFELKTIKLHLKMCLDNIELVQKTTSSNQSEGDIYQNEDFQNISVAPQGTSNQFPQGWDNNPGSAIARFDDINNFILLESSETYKTSSVATPEQQIEENTKLRFKITANKSNNDNLELSTFKVRITKRENEADARAVTDSGKVIATYTLVTIISDGDTDFNGEFSPNHEIEIDLSAYKGQTLRFTFEMATDKANLKLFLDDIKLVRERVKTLSLKDPAKEMRNLTLYPNPAENYITVHLNGNTIKESRFYTTDGRLIKTTGKTESIWIGDLPKGIYSIQIIADSGNRYMAKIVKK